MNYLELVQALHREAKLPGSAPASVTGQVGRAADLVSWISEAYNDIQRDKAGRWHWLLAIATANGFSNKSALTLADDFSGIASRFRRWHTVQTTGKVDDFYAVAQRDSIGNDDRHIVHYIPFSAYQYRYGSQAPVTSAEILREYSVRHHTGIPNMIVLGPTPSVATTFSAWYWKSNQTLAADDDIPEMPEDYHMLIVYRAMVKYGYNAIAQELLARAAADGAPIYETLVDDQFYGNTTLHWPGALA